jgi:hypothetical protein
MSEVISPKRQGRLRILSRSKSDKRGPIYGVKVCRYVTTLWMPMDARTLQMWEIFAYAESEPLRAIPRFHVDNVKVEEEI